MTGLEDIELEQMTPVEAMRAELLDSAGLDGIPEPRWLIDKILPENSLAWLYGMPGSGKSFVALDFAASVATGLPWQDHAVEQGAGVYLAGEGVAGMRKRVRAWEDAAGPADGLRFMPRAVQVLTSHFDAFIEVCCEEKTKLVVLDTQARITVGVEENSSTEMGRVVSKLDELRRQTGACVLIVHHSGWTNGHARGSSAIQGGFDTVIKVDRPDLDGNLTLINEKQKDAPEFGDIELRMIPRLGSVILAENEPDRLESHAEIMKRTLRNRLKWWKAYQGGWVGNVDLNETFDRTTAWRLRRDLEQIGLIGEQTERGVKQFRLLTRPVS
jgi:hypothetical protein